MVKITYYCLYLSNLIEKFHKYSSVKITTDTITVATLNYMHQGGHRRRFGWCKWVIPLKLKYIQFISYLFGLVMLYFITSMNFAFICTLFIFEVLELM